MKIDEVFRHQRRIEYLAFRTLVLNAALNNVGFHVAENGQHYRIIEPVNTTGFDPNVAVRHVTKELFDARIRYFHEVESKRKYELIGVPNVTDEMSNQRVKELPVTADFSKPVPWAPNCKTIGVPD